MNHKIRWGILGCGNIAAKFASDLIYVNDAELVSVGSRSLLVADEFAKRFSAPHSHGSYEALVADKAVDVIYVATPHGLHHEHVLLCAENKKAVLCEKAFAINLKQTKDMLTAAVRNQVFLMEALWTKFLPNYAAVQKMLQEGMLGDIRSMQTSFGFIPKTPHAARIYDPKLGGGTILDIGIYNVFMVMAVLGKPEAIEACMTPAHTGVDEQCAITFRYGNGAIAQLFSTFSSNLATEAYINGTKGRIRLTHRFYSPAAEIEFYPDYMESKEVIPFQREPGHGYQYEARHVCACLRKGLTESPVMRHADTVELMDVLDSIRRIAGIRYEVDG